ncbi:MAG: leucine-rich repeat protein, partial [Bacteroidaceae bacterium]|nr:leucine-rich repeat protein [Bacteroidaceae bacterium]
NIDYAGSAITVDNIIMSSTESVNMTSQDMVLHPSKIEYPTDTKFEVDGMYYVVSRQGAEVSVTYDGYNYSSPADEYSGDVVVPSNVMYKGVDYAVTSIAPNAFRDCAGVTSVTLPETVKSIGEQAFMGCTALAQIEFAEGLENIGMGAFVNCNNLTALRLPSTLKSIGDNAFRDCNKVVSVQCDAVVPPKVGSNAFTCYKNAVLYVPVTSTPAYKTTTGWSNFRCAPHEVDGYYYDIISETDVAVTYNEAGYNSYNGYVVIPDRVVIEGVEYRVTAVGDNAFRGSTELESVTLFNGITSIGANAFAGCSKLSELRVECVAPPVLQSTSFDRTHYNISLYVLMGRKNAYRQSQYWNNFTNYIEIDASAVIHPVGTQIEIDGIYYVVTTKGAKVGVSYGGSSYGSMSNEYMGEVVIPDMVSSQGVNYRVTSIEAYAFRDCKSLNAVTIPEGVTSIGQYAFYGCDGLESIAIPSGVTKIESYTYAYCRGLMAVDIPESVVTIGERAFVGCTGLSEITLPANITEIGRYAFNDCTQLKQVHSLATTPPTIYSGTFNYYTNLYVPAIATPLYKEADYWRNFTLVPHQIDGVYYEVVSDANAVVTYRDTQYNSYAGNVVIPATVEIEERVYNVTSVYNYAFYGSSALTSVTIGENIETIGYYAFKNCSSLTSVEIPDNVKILEYQSFMQCQSLKTVTLGSGVEHISGEAFYNCSTLTDLYCRATTPPEVSSSIVNNYSSVNLYVPAASMPQYREADYWRNFKFAMKESAGIYYEVLNESEVKVTYRDTQYNSYKGDVEIPTTVEIEGNTYTVVEIGDYAFYQCDSLRSVVIPE